MNHEVAVERSGWRDERISRRHRLYGYDCPSVDIDFLLVEFEHGTPAALIEYKMAERCRPMDPGHPSIRALRCLADRARIPFLMAFYHRDFRYLVVPMNEYALRFVDVPGEPLAGVMMTERGYVELLYRMRGRAVPQDVVRAIAENPVTITL